MSDHALEYLADTMTLTEADLAMLRFAASLPRDTFDYLALYDEGD